MLFSFVYCFIGYLLFNTILTSNKVIITYGVHPFNICTQNPTLWLYIKYTFIISYVFSSFIIGNLVYLFLKEFFNFILSLLKKILFKFQKRNIEISKHLQNNNEISLFIGNNSETQTPVYVSQSSLYQNILITGTIGTGKTSSAMYPFTKQLMHFNSNNNLNKLGMLILDVKGNYHLKVLDFSKEFNREDDVIVIRVNGKYKYNPLHKPDLKPSVIANRLKTILLLFSPNNSESFWLDKVEQVLTEAIKLCRLYNDEYVTFEEIHKLISYENYYKEKIEILKSKFRLNVFSKEDLYNLLSSLTFFQKEFFSLDHRTLSILKSEITRITNVFVSDYEIYNTFNPPKDKLNFLGFEQLLSEGKIVVLDISVSKYKALSKIIATYLKLDFQTEVLNRLSNNFRYSKRSVAFICDEFHEYCTISDSEFFAQSREAKCINITSTQSYTSILNALNNKSATEVIIQNLVNKIWLRTDDLFTIESAQKQVGKEDKEKLFKSISENASETNYSYITHSLNSSNSNISESISTQVSYEYKYDTNFFTQELETFSSLVFLSNGEKILEPQKINLKPYFKL